MYSLTNDDQFEIEALYYDRFGNHIASCTRNINGEYSYAYQKCDLSGTVLKSFAEYQTADGGSVTESAEHTYDHDSRLTRTRYTLNDTLVNTRYFQYDELGRLTRLSRNNGTTHASYEYDLQGNITSIKDVDFEQKLYYNTGDGTPRYNGKISSIKWLTLYRQYRYHHQWIFVRLRPTGQIGFGILFFRKIRTRTLYRRVYIRQTGKYRHAVPLRWRERSFDRRNFVEL